MAPAFEFARRKRNRPSYVCIPCKTRKVKCDKGRPCESCVTNKLEEFCEYETHIEPQKDTRTSITNGINRGGTKTPLQDLNNNSFDRRNHAGTSVNYQTEATSTHNSSGYVQTHPNQSNDPARQDPFYLLSQETNTSYASGKYLNRGLGVNTQEWQQLHDPARPGKISITTFMHFKSQMIEWKKLKMGTQAKPSNAKEKTYLGINPYISNDEIIDILCSKDNADKENAVGSPDSLTFGWRSAIKKQACFFELRKYMTAEKAEADKIPKRRPSAQPPVVHLSMHKSPTFDDNAVAANQTNQEKMDYRILTLGLAYRGTNVLSDSSLVERIKASLPNRLVTYKLVSRFFSLFIPYFPFINQDTFYREIGQIIGLSDSDKPIDIHLEKRVDLAYITMLLVMVRFSYLSLFTNVSTDKAVPVSSDIESSLFVNSPIDASTLEVARECFVQFQRKKKLSMEVLQSGMFLWTYSLFSPDEQEGVDGEYIILHGQLVSMAYSLGLHRDPDNVGCSSWSESKKNIGRRIWYFLTIMDFTSCFSTGYPMLINGRYSDTKCPSHSQTCLNVHDLEVEESVNVIFNYADTLIQGPMSDMLGALLDPTAQISVGFLTQHLNVLELGFFSLFGKTVDYMRPLEDRSPAYQYSKTVKARIGFGLKTFMMLMYLHLHTHYEKKGEMELASYYLKKLLWMGLNELMPYFFPMIGKVREFFGESSEKILNPQLQQSMQICIELSLIGIIRMNALLYRMKLAPGHKERLAHDLEHRAYYMVIKELTASFEKCARAGLIALSLLSHRYYFAWGVSRSHNYLLRVATSDDFYDRSAQNMAYDKFSLSQLGEILEIVNSSVNILERFSSSCGHVDFENMFNKKEKGEISPSGSTTGNMANTSSGSDGHEGAKIVSQFDDLNFDSGAEMDKLWLRILSERNQKDQDIFLQNERFSADMFPDTKPPVLEASINSSQPPTMFPPQPQMLDGAVYNPLYDLGGSNTYDIDFEELQTLGVFSEFPLHQVFRG